MGYGKSILRLLNSDFPPPWAHFHNLCDPSRSDDLRDTIPSTRVRGQKTEGNHLADARLGLRRTRPNLPNLIKNHLV